MDNQQNQSQDGQLDNGFFEYLNQLQQENWYDLTATFREPLSSILPPTREVDEQEIYDTPDLDAIATRLKESPGSISTNNIREWLNQFESFLDRNIAYLLLRKLQFFSETDINSLVKVLQNNLIDYLVDKEQLITKFESLENPPNKTEINLKKWLRNKVIRYARFPSPADTSIESQDRLWGFYERSSLTETSCPPSRKFDSLENHFKKASPELDVFVFMDYTNGSGNQLSKCIREINKLLYQYPQYKNSTFVFMYIVQSELFSLENIENAPPNSQTIFYEPMLHYKSSEIMDSLSDYQITEAEYDAFIEKYCLRSSGKVDAGYHQSGSLTCHHYSCPNNTLPFFHKPSENWRPLFRNSQTPNATRYRQK